MAQKHSAGILMFRRRSENEIEVLLVHPGGPFWAKKDVGSWSIPKGEMHEGEDALSAARREFKEETGHSIDAECLPLTPITQKSGKNVFAWAAEGDWDVATLKSSTFELEWPPKSGKKHTYPEVDTAEWFSPATARTKILPAQAPLIDELTKMLGGMREDPI